MTRGGDSLADPPIRTQIQLQVREIPVLPSTATTSKCTLLSIMLLLLLLFVFIVMGHVMAMSCSHFPIFLAAASTVLRAYKIFCNFVTSQLWRRHLKLHLTKSWLEKKAKQKDRPGNNVCLRFSFAALLEGVNQK